MAEVFGAAASGLGVAGVAFQLADGIKKLTDFCNVVRDAPDEIKDVVGELEDLHDLFAEIGQQYDQQQNEPHAPPLGFSLPRVLARSERNLLELRTLVKDLEADITKRKIRGSVKVVLKEKTLIKYKERLRRAQDSLMMSYNSFCNELRRQEHQLVMSQMNKLSDMSSSIQLRVAQHSTTISVHTSTLQQQIDLSSDLSRVSKGQGRSTKQLIIRLPYWLTRRTWELSVAQCPNGWVTGLRTFNLVPKDSPLFTACLEGRIDKVREILISGQGSVFDQDERGMTPLHYAVRHIRDSTVATCQLLLDFGADVNARDRNQWSGTPSWHINRGSHLLFIDPPDSDNDEIAEVVTSLHRILARSRKLDLNDRELKDLITFRFPPPQAAHALFQTMWPPWTDRSLDRRVELLTRRLHWSSIILKPSDFDPLLGIRLLDNIGQLSQHCRTRLISTMAETYAISCICGDGTDAHEWLALLREANKHDVVFDRFFHTFLVVYSYAYRAEKIRKGVQPERFWSRKGIDRMWKTQGVYKILQLATCRILRDLLDAEVDLQNFGSRRHCEFDWPTTCFWCGEGFSQYMCVVGVTYGPRPEDWRIWLSNPLDEWAGEFWDMIEHPERAIPGSWHDWDNDIR